MGLKMIVTIKQVPDTQKISSDAMKPDGTINRNALPAIINPEDLNALEEALKIKETLGGMIIVVTMGPPKAAEVLRECLFRGVDDVVMLSDQKFAGADTQATSYALGCAIEKIGNYDLVLCGRQAIDGDTAQVGPQLAQKLGLNQLTYVQEIIEINEKSITVNRLIENGHEIARSKLPLLLTITAQANIPRPQNAKLVMAYKNIDVKKDEDSVGGWYSRTDHHGHVNHIKAWDCESIEADPQKCGIAGSPTKVKKVESVVLSTVDAKLVPDTEEDIAMMIQELSEAHIIG